MSAITIPVSDIPNAIQTHRFPKIQNQHSHDLRITNEIPLNLANLEILLLLLYYIQHPPRYIRVQDEYQPQP